MRIKVLGGFAGFTGRVGSSTFSLLSLEKFLIPMIKPSLCGSSPGSWEREPSEPSIRKTRSISPSDKDPFGNPLNHPTESVTLPLPPSLDSSGGSSDLFSWKWMCKSVLSSAQYSIVVSPLSPSTMLFSGRTLSVLMTTSASSGMTTACLLGWNESSMYASSQRSLSPLSSGGEKCKYPKPAETPQFSSV